MKKNEDIELSIVDITVDGKGVGKFNDLAVFVDGALPGESVRAKVIALKKNFAVAKLMEIMTPSPFRAVPLCPAFHHCGGCTLQHLSYEGQLLYKKSRVKDCVTRIAGLDIPVLSVLPSKKEFRYRNKAVFPMQLSDDGLSIGPFAARSHRVVDTPDCMLQDERMAKIIALIRRWIIAYGISVYNERAGKGLLRHILLRRNKAGDMLLALIINGRGVPHEAELINALADEVQSIALNVNMERTNVILGEQTFTIYGPGTLIENILGLEFKMDAGSFFQVNPLQTEILYSALFQELRLSEKETVLDLFCGVGSITLHAAKRARYATGIEIYEQAVRNATENAYHNGIENACFIAGDACDELSNAAGKGQLDAVIADPPRKGLSNRLIDELAAIAPKKIGYVSCDPATLARDLKLFAQRGYKAEHIQPVDMFPQTTHVECVASMSRVE